MVKNQKIKLLGIYPSFVAIVAIFCVLEVGNGRGGVADGVLVWTGSWRGRGGVCVVLGVFKLFLLHTFCSLVPADVEKRTS